MPSPATPEPLSVRAAAPSDRASILGPGLDEVGALDSFDEALEQFDEGGERSTASWGDLRPGSRPFGLVPLLDSDEPDLFRSLEAASEVAIGEREDLLDVSEVTPARFGEHGQDGQLRPLMNEFVEDERDVRRGCRRSGCCARVCRGRVAHVTSKGPALSTVTEAAQQLIATATEHGLGQNDLIRIIKGCSSCSWAKMPTVRLPLHNHRIVTITVPEPATAVAELRAAASGRQPGSA